MLSLALAFMNNVSRRPVGGRVRDGMAGDVSSEIEAQNRGGWKKGGRLVPAWSFRRTERLT